LDAEIHFHTHNYTHFMHLKNKSCK